MTIEIADIVGSYFEQAAVAKVIAAGRCAGIGEIGIHAVIVGEVAVVALFHGAESIYLEAFHGLDVKRRLDTAAEIVAVAVGFLAVHVLHGVDGAGLGREIIAAVGGGVVDGIGGVEKCSVLEISAEIIVAVVHVGEIVLQVQPSVESLLTGGEFGDEFVAVGVLGDAFGVLIIHGCAIVELAGRTDDRDIVIVCHGSTAGNLGKPIGVVGAAVCRGVEGGLHHSIAEFR